MEYKIDTIEKQLKFKLNLSLDEIEKGSAELSKYPQILGLLHDFFNTEDTEFHGNHGSQKSTNPQSRQSAINSTFSSQYSFSDENKNQQSAIENIVMGLIYGQGNYISQYLFKPNNMVLEELKHIEEKETWETFQNHRQYILDLLSSENQSNHTKIKREDAKPFPFISLAEQSKEKENYESIGKELVREGKMIHFEPGGGSATRFRNSYSDFLDFPIFSVHSSLGQKRRMEFDKDKHQKSIYPIAPISGKSFLEMQFQRRIATCLKLAQIEGRNIISARLRITLIMVTKSTRKEVEKYLEENDYFGLRCVIIEEQDGFCRLKDRGVDAGEVIPVDDSGRLSKTGNGIGAMFQVLNKAKFRDRRLLDYLKSEKIEIMSMGNCDNASIKGETRWTHLGRMADENLGMLIASVPKSLPHKNVGLFVFAKKTLFYDDVEDHEYVVAALEYADRTDEFNTMEFNTGNTNVILYNLEKLMDSRQKLPEPSYRFYTNKIINLGNGTKVSSSSIESYHFDVSVRLEKEKVQALEIEAEDYYWATKNALGERSILTTWRYWFNHSADLLESNGAKVDRVELADNLEILQNWQRILSNVMLDQLDAELNNGLKKVESLIENSVEFNLKNNQSSTDGLNKIILYLEELFGKLKKRSEMKEIYRELLKIYHSPRLGDAQAHIEISPYFAITEDDIKERDVGKGWKIENHAQLLIEGRYTTIGDNLCLGKNSALILHVLKEVDTKGKFNSETRELLDNPMNAGAIQIEENVSVHGKLEVIVEGNGKFVIPDNFVIPEEIELSIVVSDGKTYTLKDRGKELFWTESERIYNLDEKEMQRINDEYFGEKEIL